MSDAPSVTTFVVGDRLPWSDDASAPNARGPFDAGAIYHSGGRQDCEIRKISALGATIGSVLTPALGERVAIELATGQRPAGRIAWARRGELGVRFEDSVDVVALLNRKLVSQTPERRTMPRIEVRCIAHLKCGGRFWPAMLRNISSGGLQVEGEDLPANGIFVSVFVEGLNIPSGEVVWRSGNLAGVELFEELNWTSIIPWVRSVVRKTAQSRAVSTRADETVEHLLAAGVLEIDLEFIAFYRRDCPVTELAVEHPLAEREVGAALIA